MNYFNILDYHSIHFLYNDVFSFCYYGIFYIWSNNDGFLSLIILEMELSLSFYISILVFNKLYLYEICLLTTSSGELAKSKLKSSTNLYSMF